MTAVADVARWAMFTILDDFLLGRSDAEALRCGIPARVLEGAQFRRLHKASTATASTR